jgi:hypothetical protein
VSTWYYVAGVYDAKAKTMDLYLNGELDNGFLLGRSWAFKKAPDRIYTLGSEATLINAASRARLATRAFIHFL